MDAMAVSVGHELRERGLDERDSSIGSETGQTDALSRALTLPSMATILESHLSMEKAQR